MSKHTPGPWVVDDNGFTITSDEHSNIVIAELFAGSLQNVKELRANAHLIASAPDMAPIVHAVAALSFPPTAKDDTPVFGTNGAYITVDHIKAARNAIAKAEGRT